MEIAEYKAKLKQLKKQKGIKFKNMKELDKYFSE
jgi:hypothetical protein